MVVFTLIKMHQNYIKIVGVSNFNDNEAQF